MTTRTYTTKSGTTFEWQETPELIEYINQMHQDNVGTIERGRQTTPEKIQES